MFWTATHGCHTQNEKCLDQCICSNRWIMTRELHVEMNVCFSALKTVVSTVQYSKLCTGWSHEHSHRNRKNTVCQSARNNWVHMRLQVSVSWIPSLPMMRCGVKTTSQSQKCQSPWSGNMRIPYQRRSSRYGAQRAYRCALCFGIGKEGVILLDLLGPGQSINSYHSVSVLTVMKAWISRIRSEKTTIFLFQHRHARLHTNWKTVVDRARFDFTVLAHTTDRPDWAPSFFHLFRLVRDELCGQHFLVNCASMAAVKQWAASTGAGIYKHEVTAPVNCW